MKKDWILADLDLQEIISISKNTGIDENIISILFSRGIKNEEEILKFIFPEFSYLQSPFKLLGIYEAVNRLKKAVISKERIAIFGDSDLDGITSMTIVHGVLTRTGCEPLIRYPKAKESYGLTIDIIDEFIREKVTLVITVDSGIRDIDEIKYGKQNGIDFIITDHHEPDNETPDAIIVNPKQKECGYPFKELAGVGVAFKFVQAFLYSYTPGFDVNFVLLHKKSTDYTLIFIKNGIEYRKLNIGKDEIVNTLTNELCSSDYIVLLNDESLNLSSIIKSMHKNIIISDIKKIASAMSNMDYPDNETMLEKLTDEFHINAKNSLSGINLYTKLFIELQWRGSKKIFSILRNYVVLVTIGTIADIMLLHGENRLLVKYGLSMINKGEGHAGIISLTGKSLTTSKSISWDIAPLLNAPGRMGETDLTVKFFLEQDSSKIAEILTSIQLINRERKKLVSEIIDKIKNDKSDSSFNKNIFFYMNDEIIDGIAGLIANRLADDFKKPAIIVTGTDKNGIVKGSARSLGNFDFFKHTESISHLFERVGGHAQAFGFTAEFNNIKEIIEKLNNSIADDFTPDNRIQIDLKIKIDDINPEFIKSFALLEPYGKGNEEPVFLTQKVKIDNFSSFGNLGNHGKFIINRSLQAIGWNMVDKMNCFYNSQKEVDLIFKLETNEYLGKVYPRIVLIDIDFSD